MAHRLGLTGRMEFATRTVRPGIGRAALAAFAAWSGRRSWSRIQPVTEVDILSQDEREQILVGWSGTRSETS